MKLRNSRPTRAALRAILLALMIVAVGFTLACERGADDETAEPTSEKSADDPSSPQSGEEAADEDASSDGAPNHPAEYDMEAEREARIAISRDVFGDEGPITCNTVCDCPPGFGCQGGSNRCVPSMISGRCCSWDSECPAGQPCVDENGDSSTCPE